MPAEPAIEAEALTRMPRGSLFYPSAGRDIETPIAMFHAHVERFWFVDTTYDTEDTRSLPRLPDQFQVVDEKSLTASGTTIRRHERFELQVFSRKVVTRDSGRTFDVGFCRGRGYDAFRSLIVEPVRTLSVFFHRGDSAGEGGSGFNWLKRKRLKNVLSVLPANGLVCSDGSVSIPELSEFHRKLEVGSEARMDAKPFSFQGREFNCVGYAGERYGPTLIWQVS